MTRARRDRIVSRLLGPSAVEPRPYLDGPMCVRELKPSVPREGHALTDHVDYFEEPEPLPVCPNCQQWQHPRSDGSADCLNECKARGFA
jgi:hypothetical protein